MTAKLQSAVLIAVSCALLFSQIQANILSPNNAERNEESNSNSNEGDFLFWREIRDSTFPEDFQAYLDQFPNGAFVPLAKIRLERLHISFWRKIKNSRFPEDFQAYLDQFPNGIFVALAKIRLERLQKTETEIPSEPSPRRGSTKRHSAHPVNVNDHLICTPQTRPNAVYSGCWMRIQNQVSCYLWNSKYFGDYTVTWNGQCLNSIAHGSGTYIWTVPPSSPHLPSQQIVQATGELFYGTPHGPWVLYYMQDRLRLEAIYTVDGKISWSQTRKF